MQRRSNGRRKNSRPKIPKKVIRCNFIKLIVWGHELCDNFNAGVDSANEKNCKYSF